LSKPASRWVNPTMAAKDVGTSILTGATTERFEIVKWFYIEAYDDTGRSSRRQRRLWRRSRPGCSVTV
jgi:hypothetical protein